MKIQCDIVKKMGGDDAGFRLRARFRSTGRNLVLFGPSGSGKTLTLQAIAGLLTPDAGRIEFEGQVLFDAAGKVNRPARRRRVGYLFQDYALFPHLTVWENVAFGLKPLFGRVSAQDARRVDELVDLFGLDGVARLRPQHISGGQKQRTALARALAMKPSVLLLDEPFSALDQPLRLRMRRELSRALSRFDLPMIMVTHDVEEVAAFADTVVIYNRGSVAAVHQTADLARSDGLLADTLHREVARAYEDGPGGLGPTPGEIPPHCALPCGASRRAACGAS
jgi:molybdate transport system ATP-binding protein